ncbi:MAG TPA: tRNA lysidine(34) synthetase TilS [Candidatus Paceibacterota bacterium]|nr:tRNA lysidine(34) synthetase TilS [Candidatus Paceibacterota bacterium]
MRASATGSMVAIRSALRSELAKIAPGEKVIVACSGGADSLALSFALSVEAKQRAIQVIGVTVDHQLQEGSGEQAQRVVDQLARMGIQLCEIAKVNVSLSDGLEASARRARYLALDAACERHGARKVFLGHTRDDQAESVLLGLARGSGTRSLSAMATYSGKYVRPLLGITREQTVGACKEAGLIVWDDPHNEDPKFLRSRVRTQVLPFLEEKIGPGIAAALARSASLLRDDADALDEWAMSEFEKVDPTSMDIAALALLPRAVRSRVIRAAIYANGAPPGSISLEHLNPIEALVTSWSGQGAVSLPGGVKVERLSGRLSLSPPVN